MTDQKDSDPMAAPIMTQEIKKPDDTGGLNIRGHIKIYDPETDEVYIISNNA